jgi:hypothetical protein
MTSLAPLTNARDVQSDACPSDPHANLVHKSPKQLVGFAARLEPTPAPEVPAKLSAHLGKGACPVFPRGKENRSGTLIKLCLLRTSTSAGAAKVDGQPARGARTWDLRDMINFVSSNPPSREISIEPVSFFFNHHVGPFPRLFLPSSSSNNFSASGMRQTCKRLAHHHGSPLSQGYPKIIMSSPNLLAHPQHVNHAVALLKLPVMPLQ